METIQTSMIWDRRTKLDFEILEINIQFDLHFLQTTIRDILKEYLPIKKDGYKTYSGLGLQYSDPNNPIFDCVEQTAFLDSSGKGRFDRPQVAGDFLHKNELAQRLSFVFEAFPSINLFRGRILQAAPGHVHKTHTDGPIDCRIHIPVFTNDKCVMHFEKTSYHLPANGKAYLCNTSRPHYFENMGNGDRIHIVFVI